MKSEIFDRVAQQDQPDQEKQITKNQMLILFTSNNRSVNEKKLLETHRLNIN